MSDIPTPDIAHSGTNTDIADAARAEGNHRYPNSAALANVFTRGAEWAAGHAKTTNEPPYPSACENCGMSYDACTARIRKRGGGAGKACCSTCGYTATHSQNEWEASKRERDRAETATEDSTIRFLVQQYDRLVAQMAEALGLDPDRDDDCVPECEDGPAGSEHLLWHLIQRANGTAETTTATTEDAALTIRHATLDDGTVELDEVFADNATVHLEKMDTASWWLRIDVKPIASLYPPGLVTSRPLATARTRPTRDAIHRAIAENDHEGQAADWYYDNQADSVMALLADKPTEAEAGARALEQAAEEIDWEWETVTASDGRTSIRQHGAAPSTLLRGRAARLRGGDPS